MLVLSRRRSEEIVLNGGEIIIQVVQIKGGAVRIGVTAPDNVSVNRREIHDRIAREKKGD